MKYYVHGGKKKWFLVIKGLVSKEINYTFQFLKCWSWFSINKWLRSKLHIRFILSYMMLTCLSLYHCGKAAQSCWKPSPDFCFTKAWRKSEECTLCQCPWLLSTARARSSSTCVSCFLFLVLGLHVPFRKGKAIWKVEL